MAIQPKEAKVTKPKITTLRQYFGLEQVLTYGEARKEEGLSTRLVGIEIEVENHDLVRQPMSVWVGKEDGSLRNDGREWVTMPIQARYAPIALENLLTECLHPECCFSPRTSVHVHVNCQDLQQEKILNVVMLYSIFEKQLYQFAGRNRDKNIFCVPVTETSLLDGLSGKQTNAMVDVWSKYSGLNLHPLSSFGTIEFRHMHGTRDVPKLMTWIQMLTNLVDYVHNNSLEDVRKLCFHFGEGMDVPKIIADIFGSVALDNLQYRDYSDVQANVDNMKRVFLTPADTWQKARAELKPATAAFFTTRIVKGI